MIQGPSAVSNGKPRTRLGLAAVAAGLFIFILGAYPQIFGLDRSPVMGFLQIAVFLIGLALICLGGYLTLIAEWNGGQLSILADIGLRLVATGYVIAVASGMADVFGFGTQPLPEIPYFGVWQEAGVLAGMAVIGVGFLLLIPYRRSEPLERLPDDTQPRPVDSPAIAFQIEGEEKP